MKRKVVVCKWHLNKYLYAYNLGSTDINYESINREELVACMEYQLFETPLFIKI